MQLSDGWMIFVFLPLTLYVVLDGYDLGIGVLTLLDRDPERRRRLHDVMWVAWDGNETWLVMLALALWAGAPLAAGVALPALYVPLMLVLFSLLARGVAGELIDHYQGWHRGWGRLFGVASLLAAFCQGAAFGAIVAGLPVRGSSFSGGPFTFLHNGYAVLTGLTAVALYLVAGCAVIYLKSNGELQARSARSGRVAVLALAAGTAASWLLAPVAGPLKLDAAAASRLPIWIAGSVVLAVGLAFAFRFFAHDPHHPRSDGAPALATLAIYAGGLLIAGGLVYPALVPPNITVHAAASPRSTLLFLFAAAGIFVPLFITYQVVGYWVFRGKAADGYEPAGEHPAERKEATAV